MSVARQSSIMPSSEAPSGDQSILWKEAFGNLLSENVATRQKDTAVSDLLFQISAQALLRLYGSVSIIPLRAQFDALTRQEGFSSIFTTLVQQLTMLYPGPRGLKPKPFPLVFAIDKIYHEDHVPVPFNRIEKGNPYGSKARLRAYKKARDCNSRAWLGLLAAGSKELAIAAAERCDWDESLYRFQGAFLRLLTRQKRATIEAGWILRNMRLPAQACLVSHPVPEFAFERELKGMSSSWFSPILTGRPALMIRHEEAVDRDAWLHELFDIWYRVAHVNAHRASIKPWLKSETGTCLLRAFWAVENAADQLRPYPSNSIIRHIQLNSICGWLFLCLAIFNAHWRGLFGGRYRTSHHRPQNYSCTFFEAAAKQARQTLGNSHPWTKECESKVELVRVKWFNGTRASVDEWNAREIIELFGTCLSELPRTGRSECLSDFCACQLYTQCLDAVAGLRCKAMKGQAAPNSDKDDPDGWGKLRDMAFSLLGYSRLPDFLWEKYMDGHVVDWLAVMRTNSDVPTRVISYLESMKERLLKDQPLTKESLKTHYAFLDDSDLHK